MLIFILKFKLAFTVSFLQCFCQCLTVYIKHAFYLKKKPHRDLHIFPSVGLAPFQKTPTPSAANCILCRYSGCRAIKRQLELQTESRSLMKCER